MLSWLDLVTALPFFLTWLISISMLHLLLESGLSHLPGWLLPVTPAPCACACFHNRKEDKKCPSVCTQAPKEKHRGALPWCLVRPQWFPGPLAVPCNLPSPVGKINMRSYCLPRISDRTWKSAQVIEPRGDSGYSVSFLKCSARPQVR